MNYKEYLISLRDFLVIAIFVFIFSVFYGYFAAQSSPEELIKILEGLEEMYAPLLSASPIVQFLFVFLNNSLALLLTIGLSIVFGIVPLIGIVL